VNQSFSIEERTMLYDIFHIFILADKLRDEKCNETPATDNQTVMPFVDPVNEMDLDTVSSNDQFVIVKRSKTECLLETITDTGDIFVSKLDIATIDYSDNSNLIDKVKEVAGTSLERHTVFLLQLKYNDELKITEWVEEKQLLSIQQYHYPAKLKTC
jgi:hypothetical protein